MTKTGVCLMRCFNQKTFRQQLCSMMFKLIAAAVSCMCLPALAGEKTCAATAWPEWTSWASRYIQDDGRVLSSSLKQDHSTSEGQAYNMFFALVGNDPVRFDHLWQWTLSNMMGSDPDNRLPGWLWGHGEDGKWQLQDVNSASDADLWMAYALLEAARVWHRPDYQQDALRLLDNIESALTVDLPGLGKMVLPGPVGFVQQNEQWTLNPSYLPLPLLRRLAKEKPAGPWKQIADNTVRMIQHAAHQGYVADWVGYHGTSSDKGQFVVDPIKGDVGSYDAIRVYLWAGMAYRKDKGNAALLAALDGMKKAVKKAGFPPEKVYVMSGRQEGKPPFGFDAALVPYLTAKGESGLAEQLQRSAQQSVDAALAQSDQHSELLYYNVMLSLFGLGWAEGRYQFREDGTLNLSWEKSCVRAVLH